MRHCIVSLQTSAASVWTVQADCCLGGHRADRGGEAGGAAVPHGGVGQCGEVAGEAAGGRVGLLSSG